MEENEKGTERDSGVFMYFIVQLLLPLLELLENLRILRTSQDSRTSQEYVMRLPS